MVFLFLFCDITPPPPAIFSGFISTIIFSFILDSFMSSSSHAPFIFLYLNNINKNIINLFYFYHCLLSFQPGHLELEENIWALWKHFSTSPRTIRQAICKMTILRNALFFFAVYCIFIPPLSPNPPFPEVLIIPLRAWQVCIVQVCQ